MADFKLLKEIKLVQKLSLATRLMEYYDWEDDMENFFWGRGLESVVKIYYAKETFVLIW